MFNKGGVAVLCITALSTVIPNSLREYCLIFVSAVLTKGLALNCECYCNTPKRIIVLLPIRKKIKPTHKPKKYMWKLVFALISSP